MPSTYRDRKRQAEWLKAKAKREVAQEQADMLSALGVPTVVRDGWCALQDPDGLAVRLSAQVTPFSSEVTPSLDEYGDPCPCPWCTLPHWEREMLDQPRPPTAEATRPTCVCQGCMPWGMPAKPAPEGWSGAYPTAQWPGEGGRR